MAELKRIIKQSSYSILYNAAMMVNTFLFSFLVISILSKQTWNEYTKINLISALILQAAYFGNREYLLIKYAKEPSSVKAFFGQNFSFRLFILLMVLPFILLNNVSQGTLLLILAIVVIRFLYQSYDSLIVFNKKFRQVFIVEMFCGSIILTCFYVFNISSSYLDLLLIILLISDILKCFCYIFLMGFPSLHMPVLTKEFKGSLPFFLIGLSGFIASKIDVYVTGISLSEETLGSYQILSGFLLLLQAVANYIFMPYTKFIARLKFDTVKKMSVRLFMLGISICFIGILIIIFVLDKFYRIDISISTILLGTLCCLPVYFFLPYTYYIMRSGKSKVLILANLLAAITSAGFWIPVKDYLSMKEINIPLLIMLSAQVITLCIVYIYANNLSNAK